MMIELHKSLLILRLSRVSEYGENPRMRALTVSLDRNVSRLYRKLTNCKQSIWIKCTL